MTMRLIGDCLDSELIARIEELRLGQPHTAGGGNREAGPFTDGWEEDRPSGNVIVLPVGRPKRTARRHSGPAVVVCFDLAMRKRGHG